MFTVQQIEAAHAKVRSGADFPAYIREIKALGVRGFETWVADSHTVYLGDDNYQTQSQPIYAVLQIAGVYNGARFKERLKLHQQGGTDYYTFCTDCASAGVEKWIVSLVELTCTYYDIAGNSVLVEQIPA